MMQRWAPWSVVLLPILPRALSIFPLLPGSSRVSLDGLDKSCIYIFTILSRRMKRSINFLKTYWWYIPYGFFSLLLLQITWQYRHFMDDVAFLRIKRTAVTYAYYLPLFFVHVWASVLVLPAGFSQFSGRLRRRTPVIHRRIGWLYAGVVLGLAAPSGLVIGWHANGGPSSRLAFILLAIAWWVSTVAAVITARKKVWTAHREWMIRSFALTLSAITLRAWKWAIVAVFAPPPMDTYRLVAWLGWIPNLLIAEWLIRGKRSPLKKNADAREGN